MRRWSVMNFYIFKLQALAVEPPSDLLVLDLLTKSGAFSYWGLQRHSKHTTHRSDVSTDNCNRTIDKWSLSLSVQLLRLSHPKSWLFLRCWTAGMLIIIRIWIQWMGFIHWRVSVLLSSDLVCFQALLCERTNLTDRTGDKNSGTVNDWRSILKSDFFFGAKTELKFCCW